MKSLLKIFLITPVILLFVGCTTTEPPDPPPVTKPTLTLELEDAHCTEAWLQLNTKDLTLPAELTLKQYNPTGDSVSQTFSLSTKDTLLYIDSLLPNQTYKFIATMQQSSNSNNELMVTTMDTTSHDFTFTSWTFGTIGSSVLYDVAIINENNIWAVGEIMIADTSQNGYTTYNAVHWDGNQWELKRIPYYFNNQTFYGAIRSIFAFNENDIWFGTGNMIHWNGIDYISVYVGLGMTINKIWGSSNQNVYIVGNNGSIAHYNGTSWQRIESGANTNIVDIFGIQNEDGKYIKYCAADNLLIIIDGDNNLTNIAVEQGMFLNSVWAASNRLIYTAGNGIVLYKNDSWEKINTPGINTIYRIKGQSFNDIVGLSANLSIFHFNGYNWNSIQTGLSNIYVKLQIKNNTIATVGWQNDKAIITILVRT